MLLLAACSVRFVGSNGWWLAWLGLLAAGLVAGWWGLLQVPIPDDDGFELLFSAPKPLTHQAPRDLEATAGPPSNTSKSSMTPTPTSAASQGLSSEQLSSPHRNVDAILRQWTPPPSTTPTNRTSPNYFRAADRPRPGTLPDVSSLSKPAWQSYEAQQLKYSYAHEQLFGDQLRKVLLYIQTRLGILKQTTV